MRCGAYSLQDNLDNLARNRVVALTDLTEIEYLLVTPLLDCRVEKIRLSAFAADRVPK